MPRSWRNRDITWVASSEWPPSSKKVVAQADLFQLQHLGPDPGHLRFKLVARGHMSALQQAAVDSGQGAAIELAVDGQRQGRKEQHVGRHHVRRQMLAQAGLEVFAQRQLRVGLGRVVPGQVVPGRTGRHHIGHQLRTVRPCLGQDHRLAHRRQFQQACLDLTQLDTEAANLHLMVDATDVADRTIGLVTRQIAGTVQALARLAEGVRTNRAALRSPRFR